MHMGKNHFTEDQIRCLELNHYVSNVSKTTVKFTTEFKKYFYERHSAGIPVIMIFAECGIDPQILGESRISGFCYTVNKQAKRDSGFMDQRQDNYRRPQKQENETVEQRVKQLEHELAYTRQEVEFLKKLQMADMEARRQWESKR